VTAVASGLISLHEKNTHQALIYMAQQSHVTVKITGMLDDVEIRKIVSYALQPLLQ
jgi:hypothetical protein